MQTASLIERNENEQEKSYILIPPTANQSKLTLEKNF